MAKIFGISDLPVSTIDKALKGYHFEPIKRVTSKPSKNALSIDSFHSKNSPNATSVKAKIKNYLDRLAGKNK